VGSSGTGGHPPPGPRAGRFPVLLRRGLQQECHRGLRRTGNDRGGLRLLPLWTGGCYGKFRPASRTPALAISGPSSDLCRRNIPSFSRTDFQEEQQIYRQYFSMFIWR